MIILNISVIALAVAVGASLGFLVSSAFYLVLWRRSLKQAAKKIVTLHKSKSGVQR